MMREWKSQIDAQRQAWKELAMLRNAGGMPVSELHAQEYFSSDDDVDEEDDIITPLPELQEKLLNTIPGISHKPVDRGHF